MPRNKRDRDTEEFRLLGPEVPPISAEGQVLLDEIDLLADDVLTDTPDEKMLFVAPPTKQGVKRLKIAVRVLFALTTVICLLLVSMLLLYRTAPNGFGKLRFFVEHTDAMRPAIPRGSLLVTSYRAPAQIKKGDIVTYNAISGEHDTRLTRIVEEVTKEDVLSEDGQKTVEKYTYTTRRASTEQLDSLHIDHPSVLGVKLIVIPYFGYVISFMYLYGWGFAVLATAMFVAAVMLRRWVRDRSPKRSKAPKRKQPQAM